MTDPAFSRINRLFVLTFENEEDRTSFSNYYAPKVEIKDCNVLIDSKILLMCQEKTKKKHTKRLLKWVKIMITQLVIYRIMNIFQIIAN